MRRLIYVAILFSTVHIAPDKQNSMHHIRICDSQEKHSRNHRKIPVRHIYLFDLAHFISQTQGEVQKRYSEKMSKADVVLLDCWVSPFCMRVKIALEEKGVAYETQAEDLLAGKSELLLTSNPHGKVPVLLHNGKPVSESANIVQYIDETWTSSSPFLPACAYARAEARFWDDYMGKKVFDAGKGISMNKGEVAKKDFAEIIMTLEKALGDKDFFNGDTFGYVDIIGIAMVSWFPAYEKFGNCTMESHSPKFTAWIMRCFQRESVSKTIPDTEVIEFVTMYGAKD